MVPGTRTPSAASGRGLNGGGLFMMHFFVLRGRAIRAEVLRVLILSSYHMSLAHRLQEEERELRLLEESMAMAS